MLEISLSRQAHKFLNKLHPKHRRQVAGKVQELRVTPFPNDHKQLKGHAPFCRVDAGEYRIIYRVEEGEKLVLVAIIGKRNDDQAYKLFQRKGWWGIPPKNPIK